MGILCIQTTIDDEAIAHKIARRLVKKQLAACVQLSQPVHSYYRWQGKLEHSLEYVLSIKTSQGRKKAVLRCLRRLHPYETPELLISKLASSDDYQQWLCDHT